jgi:signal transduction histidine kinase
MDAEKGRGAERMDAMVESIPVVEGKPDPKAPGQNARAADLGERDLAELLGAFNDVTAKLQSAHESLRAEVVRLQGELRQANEQIERGKRLAALGEMAAGIAHEVRNPLGSIRLYARMLVDDLAVGGDRQRERAVAEKIGAATRGLDAVVTDVLAFARETRLDAAPVEVGGLITRAVEECLASDRDENASAGRVHVVRDDEMAEMDGEIVVCDPSLLHRTLVNVMRNGIQAMRDAGGACELRISVERRSLPDSSGAAREFTAIVVRDSGPGIPPGVMERMFNPFFTTRATGTGLGLAIVHRILDAHGGRVLVRNAEPEDGRGGGAVVELLLPDVPAGRNG